MRLSFVSAAVAVLAFSGLPAVAQTSTQSGYAAGARTGRNVGGSVGNFVGGVTGAAVGTAGGIVDAVTSPLRPHRTYRHRGPHRHRR